VEREANEPDVGGGEQSRAKEKSANVAPHLLDV